jgi:hypothetical protein
MTGYTYQLVDKNLDFKNWVLCCARAFSPYVSLRDESIDTPTPTELKPSDYYLKHLCEVKSERAELEKMDRKAALAYGQKNKDAAVDSMFQLLKEKQNEKHKMLSILGQVQSWEPPTDEHIGLKDFMIQQLEDSIKDINLDYYVKEVQRWEAKDPLTIYNDQLEYLVEEEERTKERLNKVLKQIEHDNTWIRQLLKSIGE